MTVESCRQALKRHPDAEKILPARELKVVQLRAEGLTLREVGHQFADDRYGYPLSSERVRQLEGQALDRLRRRPILNTPEGLYHHERFGGWKEIRSW